MVIRRYVPRHVPTKNTTNRVPAKELKKVVLFILGSFVVFSLLYSTPFTPSVFDLLNGGKVSTKEIVKDEVTNITPSSEIRKYIWQAAIETGKHYPLLGTGVETFAYDFYRYKPLAHNLTSEWDFLYNKAHNEYLNYWATTGALGLGSYLLLIGSFGWWMIKHVIARHADEIRMAKQSGGAKMKNIGNTVGIATTFSIEKRKGKSLAMTDNIRSEEHWLALGLFAGWVTILVTNFFGFSTVVTNMWFFVIPGIIWVIVAEEQKGRRAEESNTGIPEKGSKLFFGHAITALKKLLLVEKTRQRRSDEFSSSSNSKARWLFTILITGTTAYGLWLVGNMVRADLAYVKAQDLNNEGKLVSGLVEIEKAVKFRPNEPEFTNEMADIVGQLAVVADEQEKGETARELEELAIAAADQTVGISPANVNYWKNRGLLYITLSKVNEEYFQEANLSLEIAKELSSADPVILYNQSLIAARQGDSEKAINLLEEAVKLKPDYQDGLLGLATFYHSLSTEEGKVVNAKAHEKAVEYMEKLNRYHPDEVAKERLEEWRDEAK